MPSFFANNRTAHTAPVHLRRMKGDNRPSFMVPVGSYQNKNPYKNIDVRCTVCYNIQCKEEKQMRGQSRKKKKSNSNWKAWLADLLKDLIVGIILLMIQKWFFN